MRDEEITRINQAAWNQVSQPYQASAWISLEDVHYGPMIPGERELNLLGGPERVRGRRCLDVGCGGGQNSIVLARWGGQVVGLDISGAQLAHARRLARQAGVRVRFIQGDAGRMDGLADRSFDIVISVGALMFVADLDAAIAEVARVLAPHGVFVWSMNHPVDRCLVDPDGEPGYAWTSYWPSRRRVLGDDVWDFGPEDRRRVPACEFYYTTEDMVETLARHGFVVERLLEPLPLDPQAVPPRRIPYLWPDLQPDHAYMRRLQRVPPVILFRASLR
ncbi:MAG: class I SAM-dependent methyltransferase [Chloroflexi bacterium]|nr:class I SAM-dependent methyltransferase [Chloroflexota bacterium]